MANGGRIKDATFVTFGAAVLFISQRLRYVTDNVDDKSKEEYIFMAGEYGQIFAQIINDSCATFVIQC
jgi:hypothetical protein